MSTARRLLYEFKTSSGRTRVATVLGVFGAAILAILLGVLPAIAGAGLPSDEGVIPTEIDYGGGSGGCAFVGSPYEELHINNPITGTFASGDGAVEVELTVDANDEYFSYSFTDPSYAAFQITVNGGQKSTLFDNESQVGPLTADGGLHAPTKGNSQTNLFKLSHVNICYGEVVPNVTGTKYHDRDTDGDFDVSEEEGLAGWTIAAFDSGGLAGEATTRADGSYTLTNLGSGVYTICEATNTNGLPDNGTGFTWAWTQSEPAGNTDCPLGYEPAGEEVTLESDDDLKTDIDFGNHRQVAINCDSEVTLSLGGTGIDDNPFAEVTIPALTPSCSGGNVWLATFDLGQSQDGDSWNQFVAFSGIATNAPRVIDMEIQWDAEDAVYFEGNLVVDTTEISLELPADPLNLVDIELCGSLTGGLPTETTPVCLDSRTIEEGGSLPVGQIQVTDRIKFLGDPGYFR